jgi:hypothetical protein
VFGPTNIIVLENVYPQKYFLYIGESVPTLFFLKLRKYKN